MILDPDRLKLKLRQLRKTARNPQGKPAIIRPAAQPRHFENYVFIAGLHRSGTTLMEQMLEAHCDLCSLRADVPENEGQHLQDVVPAARDAGGPGRFAFSPRMHTPPASGATAHDQRTRLLQCWAPWVSGEGQWLMEKSPPNLVRIPWLRSLFPGARFLIMMRDPRVTAAATQKWSGTSMEEMVYHWHVAYAAARQVAAKDCMFLRYEDMCSDPAASLTQVIETLELKRRPEPLPLAKRFATIRNSNEKYFATLPKVHFGPGVWQDFGYDLTIWPAGTPPGEPT